MDFYEETSTFTNSTFVLNINQNQHFFLGISVSVNDVVLFEDNNGYSSKCSTVITVGKSK